MDWISELYRIIKAISYGGTSRKLTTQLIAALDQTVTPTGGGGGGGSLQSATVTITNDQIKSLPNAPWIAMVSAPAANQYILPVITSVRQDFRGAAYGNVQTGTVFADVGYIDGSSFFAFSASPLDVEGAFIDFSNLSDWFISTASQTGPSRSGLSLGFTVTNSGENFTLGNASNTLKITSYYMVVDVS